jgi:site-specific recombinase XerD
MTSSHRRPDILSMDGLRASEVVRLKVANIDSTQRIIRVVHSKGARTATSVTFSG